LAPTWLAAFILDDLQQVAGLQIGDAVALEAHPGKFDHIVDSEPADGDGRHGGAVDHQRAGGSEGDCPAGRCAGLRRALSQDLRGMRNQGERYIREVSRPSSKKSAFASVEIRRS